MYIVGYVLLVIYVYCWLLVINYLLLLYSIDC